MSQLGRLLRGTCGCLVPAPCPSRSVSSPCCRGDDVLATRSCPSGPCPRWPRSKPAPGALAQVISNTPGLHNRVGGAGEGRNSAGICP